MRATRKSRSNPRPERASCLATAPAKAAAPPVRAACSRQRLTAQLGVGDALTRYSVGSGVLHAPLYTGVRLSGGRVQQFVGGKARHVQAQVDAV